MDVLRNLISMIDSEYQDGAYTSFANTVYIVSQRTPRSNTELYDRFRRDQVLGDTIDLVVSNKVYAYCQYSTTSEVYDLLEEAADAYGVSVSELSDRKLVNYIQNKG